MKRSRKYFDVSEYSVSEIIEREFMFTWKIKGYENLSRVETGYPICSARDSSIGEDTPWRINFYPNNAKQNNSYICVSIVFDLKSVDCLQCSSYKWTACLIDIHENEVYVKEFSCIKNKDFILNSRFNSTGDMERFLHKNVLISKKDSLLPNDTLTLRCKIYIQSKIPILNVPVPVNQSKFIGFENMLNKEEYSDVKINVGNQIIFVHKGILATKSPVFAAMFKQNMQENNKNVVHILDVDYNVMYEMFYFMYTGKLNNIQLIAEDLLIAADKYEVEDLKLMCEETLACNLNIDTVIDLFILAEKHTAKTLKEDALHYIKANARELIRTKKFEEDLNILSSGLSLLDIMKVM